MSRRGFENKRRLIPLSGINTFSDYIEYDNHGFEDGELIDILMMVIRIGLDMIKITMF